MSTLTREPVLAHAHPLDDATISQIIATGASQKELERACAFSGEDKRLHRHDDVPAGRIGSAITILERAGSIGRSVPAR